MCFGNYTIMFLWIFYVCIISQINDKANDGTGAYVKIVAGGVGYNYIEVELTSQRGRSINHNVELWGEKP